MRCENCSKLEQRIIQLEKLVAELQRRLARHENSNTPPSAGGSYPQREPSGKPPGAQLGHAGTTREQKKPDEIRDAPSLTKCPECQHMLGDPIGAIPCIFEDIPKPQPAKIIQVNQGIYECPGCGEILIAEDSQCPKSGRFGFNLIAEAVMMRFEQRLPLRKIQQALHNQFQLDLTPASIWMLIKRAAAAGEEEYNKIFKEMYKQNVVNADETSRNVNGKVRWLWVFVSAASILYLAGRGRGKKAIEDVLGEDFKGILGCDGWKPYTLIKLLQRCWAHLLRESKTLSQRFNRASTRQIHSSLKELFKAADGAQKAELSAAERQRVHDRLNQMLLGVIQLAKEHKKSLKFGEKIENGMGHWFTAVLHPEVELTNNVAERALRESVIQRKISGSLRSKDGAHAMEILMTLLATWKLRGKNPREMLLQTLQGS
ncbi:TPA: IS66 family transposase [Candidatus Micrarchaeota archaeon]|nr:IS66 family transposase [Candidatus Micrarchaeota archaeon]